MPKKSPPRRKAAHHNTTVPRQQKMDMQPTAEEIARRDQRIDNDKAIMKDLPLYQNTPRFFDAQQTFEEKLQAGTATDNDYRAFETVIRIENDAVLRHRALAEGQRTDFFNDARVHNWRAQQLLKLTAPKPSGT